MIFHDDGQVRFYLGDVREQLRSMPAESVHMAVTSPPYWGLRDYGTATWEGGDAECDHAERAARNDVTPERLAERAEQYGTGTGAGSAVKAIQYRDICGKCGARRVDQQLGLEATPEEFIANMVDVFREVKRVLRKDGTVWCNIGDSYASGGMSNPSTKSTLGGGKDRGAAEYALTREVPVGLKPKDLCGIPWMLAFALRADGWYLRSEIIWAKPNPMPESVTDRPTKAHEQVFLLSKSASYYYDADAIREESAPSAVARQGIPRKVSPKNAQAVEDGHWNGAPGANGAEYGTGRNRRTVWTIPTEPFPESHFAVFPQALVKPCILAGTSERGVCAECGAPWAREVAIDDPEGRLGKSYHDHQNDLGRGQRGVPDAKGAPVKTTTGWRPTCSHESPTVPATVLDPFLGSGTTALVARSLGRKAIGIDLNRDYLEMAKKRCAQMGLL